MTCQFCGKVRCVHLDPEDDQYVAPVEAKLATQPATEEVARQPLSGSALFQLVGLRDLECQICRYCAPVGPYQAALRFQHGMLHVKAGQAVAVRRGLPAGAVRFEIA